MERLSPVVSTCRSQPGFSYQASSSVPRGQTDDVLPPVAIQIRHHRLVAAGQLTVDDVGDEARSGSSTLLGPDRPEARTARNEEGNR